MTDPWLREDKPFNFTSTGYLGIKREEMLNNHLLEKARIGLAKKGVQNICPDTVFGHNYRGQWTVANAVTGWAGLLPQLKEGGSKKNRPITDFIQLNRGSLTAAVTVSNEVRSYRKTKVPIRPLYDDTATKKLERPPAKVFKFNQLFGRPNVPNANIYDLLCHNYQKQWLGQAKKHDDVETEKVIDFKKIRPNRASVLRPQQIPIDVQCMPWRSSRILNKAHPSISTFRSLEALEDSLVAQSMEAWGREGATGQGIPKNTPHEHFAAPLREPHLCPATAARCTQE